LPIRVIALVDITCPSADSAGHGGDGIARPRLVHAAIALIIVWWRLCPLMRAAVRRWGTRSMSSRPSPPRQRTRTLFAHILRYAGPFLQSTMDFGQVVLS